MKLFPTFTSPLVIRPKSKQLIYMVISGIVFVILQLYCAVHALINGEILSCFLSVCIIAAVVYHVITVKGRAEQDVTVMLKPVMIISAVQIVSKLLDFFVHRSDIRVSTVLLLLCECIFWYSLAFCTVRTVCGTYKLIIPMCLLAAAFFYTFIKYDIRDVVSIVSQLMLLLLIWFPLDAIEFTSLYVNSKNEKF